MTRERSIHCTAEGRSHHNQDGRMKICRSQRAQKADRVRPPRTDCKQKQAGSHHRLWPGTRNSTGIENFNARQLFFYSHSGSIGISGRKSVRTEIYVCVPPCSLSILAFVLTVCRHGCPLSPDLTSISSVFRSFC